MTDKELQRLVEYISLQYFRKPFRHKVFFNSRLKSTGGRYHLKDHHIDINPKLLEVYGEDELIGVIKHELCHYHLHLEKRGYKHQDKDFKNLLRAVGGTRYVKPLVSPKYTYQCDSCVQLYERFKRLDTKRYRCGKCHGVLKQQ